MMQEKNYFFLDRDDVRIILYTYLQSKRIYIIENMKFKLLSSNESQSGPKHLNKASIKASVMCPTFHTDAKPS